MSWLKRKQFRNPKIYSVTPRNGHDFNVSPISLKVFFVLIIISAVIWFIFFSSFFKIKNIDIQGSLNEEVKTEINKYYGQNILTFVLGNKDIELAKRQSSIETLEIKRGLPDTLKVKVNVRIPVLGWKTQDKIYLIDKNGVIFQLSDGNTNGADNKPVSVVEDTKNIVVIDGVKIVTPEFVTFVSTFVANVKTEQNIQITSMTISDTTFQVEAQTDQGFKIIFSTIDSLDNQIKALAKALETKRGDIHEYADLRIVGRVYYK